ncbi:hypothetical protein MUP77_13130 [Candidatus Bathyarchaeota archaeon]|nr:hypothetical protein [Candidatus Bathyarchaeota archaeon]
MDPHRTALSSSWLKFTALLLGTIVTVAALGALYPKFEEQFIAMGVLGEYGTTDQYFPGNISRISVGASIRWQLYVYNHMSETKEVSIRVKLLNSTLTGPNDENGTPSPVEFFMEIPLVLASNETQILPFYFRITQVALVGDSVRITEIEVAERIFSVNVPARIGTSFRIVFELWSYEKESGSYIYSWKSAKGVYHVWNQIWFNMTT